MRDKLTRVCRHQGCFGRYLVCNTTRTNLAAFRTSPILFQYALDSSLVPRQSCPLLGRIDRKSPSFPSTFPPNSHQLHLQEARKILPFCQKVDAIGIVAAAFVLLVDAELSSFLRNESFLQSRFLVLIVLHQIYGCSISGDLLTSIRKMQEASPLLRLLDGLDALED